MTASTSGVVDLFVPPDWTEILAGEHVGQARELFTLLAEQTWPHGPDAVRRAAVAALLQWREQLLQLGAVSHGILTAPHADGTLARWQLLTLVVDLPQVPELDLAAVVGSLLSTQLQDVTYVERFATDMGTGVGLISQPLLAAPQHEAPQHEAPQPAEPVRIGLAAALACAPMAPQGLLVVAVCLDPLHVVELAALVALVAGRSRLRPPGPPAADPADDAAAG